MPAPAGLGARSDRRDAHVLDSRLAGELVLDGDGYQTFSLPARATGTVCVQVKDTDDSQGNSAQDTLYVDHMFIRKE